MPQFSEVHCSSFWVLKPMGPMSGRSCHHLSLNVVTLTKYILLTIHVDKLCLVRAVSAPDATLCQDGTPVLARGSGGSLLCLGYP